MSKRRNFTRQLAETIQENLDQWKRQQQRMEYSIDLAEANKVLDESRYISIARLMEDRLYSLQPRGAVEAVVGWELEFTVPKRKKASSESISIDVNKTLSTTAIYDDLYSVEHLGTASNYPGKAFMEISSKCKPILEAIAYYSEARKQLDWATKCSVKNAKAVKRYTNHLHFSIVEDGKPLFVQNDRTMNTVGLGVLVMMYECLPLLIQAKQLVPGKDYVDNLVLGADDSVLSMARCLPGNRHYEMRRTLPGEDKQAKYPFDPFIAANAVLMAGIRYAYEARPVELVDRYSNHLPEDYGDETYQDGIERMKHSALAQNYLGKELVEALTNELEKKHSPRLRVQTAGAGEIGR